MLSTVANNVLGNTYSIEKMRNAHDTIGASYLSKNSEFHKIFEKHGIEDHLSRQYINTINLINKFHRRKNPILDCPKERFIKNETIRSRLIASLVRLSDTLHIDTSRYDRRKYDILQIGNFDRTSRHHWLKSYVVSGVNLDINKQTIFITIDLPEANRNIDFDENTENLNFDENAENLKSMIFEDVYEDVNEVQEVFKEYDIPFYSLVKIEINYLPGIEEARAQEIVGIINDIHIVISPSTSKVIRKSLDSIRSVSEITFNDYHQFYNQISQLIEHLKKILEDRPCHVGLSTIANTIKEKFNAFPRNAAGITPKKIRSLQKTLLNSIDEITSTRKKSLDLIEKKANEMLADKTKVFLFGLSEMTAKFLCGCGKELREKIELYIFECGGKRQFSPSNNLEYNDGIYYSIMLSNFGFTNISLLPDTSFASLLNDPEKGISSTNSVLLFGTNGFDKTSFDCGHSSGHLMFSIIAKHFEIPIYVVADMFKAGTISWQPSKQRNFSLWLTGQKKWINELSKRKIKLINYREDKIPNELIKYIITEAKNIEPNP
jgi:translation initiation factor 2B subunit (eIF-2B alpha/beta/delta family)